MASPTGNDLIGIDFENDEFIQNVLPRLPQEIRDAATDDVSNYLLNILRSYPSYRYVSRKEAYGVSFFTDKQRRWFFANLDNLDIPYKRTQELSKGWQIVGSGENQILVNDAPHAGLAYGDKQSRHLAAIGWKKLPDILKERQERIQAIIKAAVKKAMRKR
jgi:hypothetical protein